MKKDIEVVFTQDEWKYFRFICQKPVKMRYTVTTVAEQLNESSKKTRRILTELVDKGYLAAKTFKVTELGEQVFKEHIVWWNALKWKMENSWSVSQEKVIAVTDLMLCTVDPEFVQNVLEQSEYARMQEAAVADGEQISGSDFFGKIQEGSYFIGFSLLDDEKDGPGLFASLSSLNECFKRAADQVIEPLKSRLELTWISKAKVLEEISFQSNGTNHTRKPAGKSVAIPLSAIHFEHVAAYKLLDGELPIVINTEQTDEHGKMIKEKWEVRLECSILYG